MSDRTKYTVNDAKGSVFLRLEEGPRELKVHLSISSARSLAKQLWGAAAAVEETAARSADPKVVTA